MEELNSLMESFRRRIMLSIMLGEFNDRCIMDVNGHFNLFKEPSWFEDEFVNDE